VLRASFVPRVIRFAEDMLEKDLKDNRSIGDLGARHLLEQTNPRGGKVTVLTHCNTGALATAGYGTALGEDTFNCQGMGESWGARQSNWSWRCSSVTSVGIRNRSLNPDKPHQANMVPRGGGRQRQGG